MMRNLFMILILACTGCSLDWPDPAQGTYACETNADCADGYYCKVDVGACEAESESCAEGTHAAGDTCVPDNEISSCWDGTTAQNCIESSPVGAEVTCSAVEGNPGVYECAHNCPEGFTEEDFECVEGFTCPAGEHLWNDQCVEDNSPTHCWNGTQGFDCVAAAPDFSTGQCVPDSNTGFFLCDFECSDGFEHDQNTCVCPDGQHEDDGGCYSNDDLEHCWNGEESIDCVALIPPNSTATCGDVDSSGFFTCGFECDGGFAPNGQNECSEVTACGEAQHVVDGVCYNKDDVQHCWNGESSIDCTASVPMHAQATCVEINSAEFSSFICGFQCDFGFVATGDQCVEAVNCGAGQHVVDNVCYENSDVQHCWDGVNSVNCFGEQIPDGSTPVCMGIGSDLFTCSFECANDYYFSDDVCVMIPANMVLVPAGTFFMGCSPTDTQCDAREAPAHDVYLDAYLIDVYEVTAGQYKDCVDAGACSYTGSTTANLRTYDREEYIDHPINNVNHAEAATYCAWKGKNLPTEAQWEKAARGESGLIYPWGDFPTAPATCDYAAMNDCGVKTQAVGSYPLGVSPYGLMDMTGNVYEWVSDWYDENYYESQVDDWTNPAGPETNVDNLKVLKGGAFNLGNSSGNIWRASKRGFSNQNDQENYYGFRCAKDAN